MGQVILNITMSLDGFTAGPNVSLEKPLGENGMRLHQWLFEGKTARDAELIDEQFKTTGAFIIGRRMFDVGEKPWGDDGAFGMPCFVLTHRPRETLIKGPTTFTFVTDGIESALRQAKAAAGDKNVCVNGGSDIADQYLKAGLIDEIHIHIVPLLFGAGTRMFDHIGSETIELRTPEIIASPKVTHLRYQVVKS